MLNFFPEFKKIELEKVIDIALGAASIHILAKSNNEVKMFAAGDN